MKNKNLQEKLAGNRPLQSLLQTYANRHKLKRLIALMSVVVVVLTMNSLTFDAETLERFPMCGFEAHVHSAECLGDNNQVICGLDEHTHTDACYQQRPVKPKPTALDPYVDINNTFDISTPMEIAIEPQHADIESPVDEVEIALGGDDAADIRTAVIHVGDSSCYNMSGGVAFLSDVLNVMGVTLASVDFAGELTEDGILSNGEHIAVVPVEGVEGEYIIRVLKDFDTVELGVVGGNNAVSVVLGGGRVVPGDEQAADESDGIASEAETALEDVVSEIEDATDALLLPPVERTVQLDFAGYIATDDHATYMYDSAMVAVLVNADEIAPVDGVEVTLPEDHAAQTGGTLFITGDGEYDLDGVTYVVAGLVLPERVVTNEAQNVIITTANDEATLLNVAPIFEETAEGYADIFSLFTELREDADGETGEVMRARALDALFGVALAEMAEARTLQMKLFNIGLQDIQTGEVVEPDSAVHVETRFDAIEGQDFCLYHIVDGAPVLLENAVVEQDGQAVGFDFYVDSLSPFALVYYTVTTHTGETYTGYSFKTDEHALNAQTLLETLGIQAIATGVVCTDEGVGIDGLGIALPETFDRIFITIVAGLDHYEVTLLAGDVLEATAGAYAVALDLSQSGLDEAVTYKVEISQLPATEQQLAAVEMALSETLPDGAQRIAKVSELEMVDIAIVDMNTGAEVEPQGPVSVSLTRDGEVVPTVVHFRRDGEVETLDVVDGAFTTASFSVFTGAYTVEYTTDNNEVTVKVDFTDIVQNGADFDTNSVITALNDGVAVRIDELEQGYIEGTDSVVNGELYIDYTTADNKNENIKNVNWIGFKVVECSDGLTVADGKIKVTRDGTVTLSDGISTINIVISNYTRLVAEELSASGVDIEVLDGSVPAGSKVVYAEHSEEETQALVSEYNIEATDTVGAFDVSIAMPEGDAFKEEGSFKVSVDVPAVEVPEGAVAVYKLYHIHEGKAEKIEAEVADGKLSFVTNSFSDFVYTVDFEYTAEDGTKIAWKWPGHGSYAIADILAEIGVTGEIGQVSLERTIDAGGSEKALYLSVDGSELISEEAFLDTFELTVVVDGKSYVLVVTDVVTRAGHTFTSLASLIDTANGEAITVNIREGSSNTVEGNTSTNEMTLHADIAYTIQNKIADFNTLVTTARANTSDPYVYLDYDITSLITAHENLSQITGSGLLYKGGIEMGEFTVSDGHVLIKLDAAKLDDSSTTFEGTFDFTLKVDTTTTTNSGSEVYEFLGATDTLTIQWPVHEHGRGTKTVDTNNTTVYAAENDNYLYYNYTLTIDGGADLTNLKLSDTLPTGMELDGNVSITRNKTTHHQQSTRTKYDESNYGVWSAWSDTSTDNNTYTASVNPTIANGVMSLDVYAASNEFAVDTVGNITQTNDTTRNRDYTQSTYTLTYRTKILKSAALAQIAEGQSSAQFTNTAKWNEDTTEIPGGSATVTITKQDLTPGGKVVDGAASDYIQVAYQDLEDINGTKYARIDYIVSITEPIDATSAVLTDKLSQYQKLKSNTAELFIGDESKGTVAFGSTGAMGETISFNLQAALQALSPQQSFTKNTTYKVKYSTLVPAEYFSVDGQAQTQIKNETDWTINNSGVPGEDKTIVITRKPYEPNTKQDKLTDYTVSGNGPWTIPWEITTTQHQDATQVKLEDKYSDDQTLDKNSFKIWIGDAEYTIPSNYIVDATTSDDTSGNKKRFTIDIDEVLSYLNSTHSLGLTAPLFKAETTYKITYNTSTSQYKTASEYKHSENQSKWEFDGVGIPYAYDDVVLEKLECKAGEKTVKDKNHDGVYYHDEKPANDVEHLQNAWATVEPEVVAASTHDNNKLLLHYRIKLQEPFGYPDITKALLTDTYDSRETLDVSSFVLKVNSTNGDGTPINSSYITNNTGNHQFTIDMVQVVNDMTDEDFTANTAYYLEYSTYIELTDAIKQLLKTPAGQDDLGGFLVRNQQAWHFEGTPGNEDKPGDETTYTFIEKPYNGGDKSVAVYDTTQDEFIATATGTAKTVISVDNQNNTLKYTISLTESRNTTKAVLHDVYSSNQTLKDGSFQVTFMNGDTEVVIPITTPNGLTRNDTNHSFDIELTRVLSDASYTFTKDVTYNITYETTVNQIGVPGSATDSDPSNDVEYTNNADWTFDDGNGTGEGGDTDIYLEESTYVPGEKVVRVVEEVGNSTNYSSDWQTLTEEENYQDNSTRISSVFDEDVYHLNYSILINEPKALTTAVLTDTFQGSANQTLVTGSFTVSIDGGERISIPDSYVDFTHPTTGFSLRFTDFLRDRELSFQKNIDYEIGFQTTTTTKNNTSVNGDGADNKAKWIFDNTTTVEGGHTETHIKVVPRVEKTYYNADDVENGQVDFGEQVKYVITIGSANDVLNEYYFEDYMTCYHHLDRSKGITVKRGDTVLATLITGNTPSGWYFQADESQTWNSDDTHKAFWLKFPTKNANGDVDFMGPITIEYYANVGSQQQTGILGTKDVINTIKSPDTEITTKFTLTSGTVELDKIALPIADDTLEKDNVIAWWRVNITPVELSLQNLYLKDFDARFSTVSAENAASGTGTTGMYVGTTAGTTYHVYYLNDGAGHAAGDPVPGNLYALDNGNLKFTGDIREPVYVIFATIGSDYNSYNGGNIYMTNSARITDSNDKTIGGPDTETKEYTEEGTITATKTFKNYERAKDGSATAYWQIEINATGTASVYGYYLKESLYRYSTNQANVQNGSWLGLDLNSYTGTVITDADGNTLVKGSDYTIDYSYGIKFMKRIPCPITVVIPMTIASLPSGTTYLYNKVELHDRDGNPTDVEGTGTITDWTIKVDKTIENNGQKPIAPNFDQAVTYKIVANSNKDPLPDGTTIVTDILPAGMEYVDDGTMYITFINSENTQLQLNNNQYVFGTLWNYLQPTVDTTVINGKMHQTLTWDFSKATKEAFDAQNSKAYGLQDYFNSDDTSTYSLNLNGASVEIGYKAKLTSDEITRLQNLGTNVPQVYNNTVTVTQGEKASGSDDVEWDYTWKNGLKKEDITDAHYAQMASKPPILWYKVSINPDARTMNNGNNLIMVDKIPTAMELNLGTVAVLDADDNPVENARVSYDGITRELTVRVPDGKACYVTFNATIENPKLDEAVSYTNSVKLKGESTWTDTVTETHTVTTLSGTVDYTIDRGFFIEKVDGNNITLKLPGAEFTLYKATFPALSNLEQVYTDYANYDNDKDSVNYDLTRFVLNPDDDTHPVVKTADTNGRVSFEHLDIGHLYYWVETKTPDDTYSAGMFAEPQYVILYQTTNKIVEPESYAHAKLLDHLISDANGIIVNTAKENYVWTATNFKETQYSVKKTWQDNDNAQRPQFIYVQLLRNNEPYDDPGTPANEGLVRIEADNLGEWDYTWYDLPAKQDGGADYVYSAYELTPEQMQTAGLITAEEQTALESRLDGYVTIYNSTTNGVEIINRKGDETSMLIEKAWEDEDNVSLLRPGFISVKLYRETLNGTEAGTIVQVAPSLTDATTIEEATRSIRIYANDNWKKEIVGLETNNGAGINYRYYIQEDDVNNYITTYQTPISLAGGEAGGLADTDGVVRITNKLDGVQVTKRWLDAEGQEAWLADVTFKLVKRNAEGVYHSVATPVYYSSKGEAWSDEITTTTENRKAIWLHLDPLGENEAYFAVEYAIAGVDESAITRDTSVQVEAGLKQPALSFTMNGVYYDVTGGTSSTSTGIVVNAPRTSVDFAKQWFNASETANADNNPKNLKIKVQIRRYSSIDGQEDTTFALRDMEFELDNVGNMQTEGDITFYDKGDWTAQWTNLPFTGWVNGESEVYQYRVTETGVVNTATNNDIAGYIAVTDKDHRAIRNYYPDQEISVSKVWSPEPEGAWSITAKLQVAQRLVERSGLRDEDAPWSEFTDYDPEGEETTQTVTIGVDANGDLINGTTYDSATGKYTSKVTLPKYRYVELTNSLYELKFTAVEDETNLPDGYLPSVVVDPETGEITITNEYQKVIVTVEKAWSPMPDDVDNASATVELRRYAIIKNGTINLTLTSNQGGAIEGATFELYKNSAATGKTFLTDASGRISVTGLSEAGDYYLQQTATAEGYRIDGTVKTDTLTVVENSTEKMQVNSNLTNTALVTAGAFTVTLKDGSNNPLQGGVFDLYKQGESTPVVTGATTDVGGQYTKDSLSEGTYYFVQTAAPTGYVLGATTQSDTFVVQDLPGEAQSKTVSFTNLIKAKGSVTISLTSSVDGNAISGAAFELYKDGTKVGEGTTDGGGVLSFANLEAGSYTVKQTSTSDGLAVAADQTFEILENGDTTQHENLMFENGKSNVRYTLKFQSTSDNLSVEYKYVVGTEVTVTFDNGNAYYNPYDGKKLIGGITGTIGDDGYVFIVTITGDVTVTIDPTSNSDWGNVVTNSLHVSPEPVSDALAANRASSFSGRTLMRTPSTTRLMGNNLTNNSAPTVIHTDATPVAPDGYANDSSFTAIPYTLRNADGWRHTFAEQDKYDADGNLYYYYVVETAHTPADYWIDSYTDALSTSGTIRITNRKEAEYGSLKVKKQAVGLTDSTKSFIIAVKDASGNYYGQNGQVVTGDAGWVTFNAGEEKLWSNLPVDISTHSTTYIVEEYTEDANINGLTLEVEGSGVSVNVAKDNTASHTVTNTYTKEFEATKEWYDGDTGAKITDFTGFTGTATLELVQYYMNGSEEVATGTTYDVELDGTVDAAPTGDNYESAAWTAKWTKLPATGTVSSATVEYFYKAREKAATKDTLTMADMVVVVNSAGTLVQNYLPTEHTVVKQWPLDWMLDDTTIEFTLTAGADAHKVEKKVRMNKNGVVSVDGVAATEAQKADGTIGTYKVKPEDTEETGKKWQYVWKNLPAGYVDGNSFVKYEYTVTEEVYYTGTDPETKVTDLYKTDTTSTAGTTVFTNIPKSKAVTVNKVWSNDLPTGMVITSVEYELRYKAYAYGADKTAENLVAEGVVASDATRTLTPVSGEWKAVTLDKTLNTYGWVTKDNKPQLVELVYEAVETSVKGKLNGNGEEEELIGYFTTEASGQDRENERILTMTNTYAPRKVQVEKIWRTLDGETITENLPKITIRLVRHAKDQEGNVVILKTGDNEALIDGGREIGEIELDGQTDEKETIAWKYTWNDLPKSGYETNANGEKLFCNFEYGVKEDTVEGYTMSLVKLDAEQYVVDVKTKKSGAANDDTFIIRNTMMPSYELPSTGGPGTTGLYIVGSILTLLALVLLITKKRTDGQGID